MDRRERENKELVAWAARALHGLDDSVVFCGVLNDSPVSAARVEFTLQIGHALLTGKPIVLTVPQGVVIPDKLRAAADRIVVYNADDPASLQEGLAKALTEMGFKKQ
jgi:hypothetical protein